MDERAQALAAAGASLHSSAVWVMLVASVVLTRLLPRFNDAGGRAIITNVSEGGFVVRETF
ncbi:MAG: hypothetical protein U9Q68_03920 [Euryarchaeota archaeon]|nr:hypothetical protein [Euryarchaeota archaeon]